MLVPRSDQLLLRFSLLVLVCMVLIGGVGLRPCCAIDLPPLRSEGAPQFTADAVISLDAEARSVLSVSVSVPYSEIQWLKLTGGYAAGIEITVVFDPPGSSRQYGDVWERKLMVPTFQATLSPVAAAVEKRSFDLPPGRYELRVLVTDVNSTQVSRAREKITVPDFSKVPVGFVDLELGTTKSSGEFQPTTTRRFGLDIRHLAARVALFDRRSGTWPRTYPFRYRILDDSGTEVLAGNRQLSLDRSAAPVVIQPDSSDLFVGAYTFEVELVEGRSHWRVDRAFEVEESGPPRGREFERVLEPLAYIATPEEVDHLRSLPIDQQAKGWEEFWKRRDPTPETARNEALLEFTRRLRYAEQHFQTFGPGWRSDMGRIYIKFGAPDQIESRPASSQNPPLEIWYYNQPNRRFVFADREGFGRFVLVSPNLE